ncbi:MAG: FxLYD domain-containing protein, partial [Panacibacter sp.]
KIKDYVAVDTYAPSQTEATGVKYRVQNISDIPVDMVMIDLQYFDASGRYVKGETVYVRNVSPQQTITIQAPDNSKAASIKYKVSMVSSEKNNLYLIAD